MTVSDLIVRITGDTKGLSASLTKAEADLGKFGAATGGAGQKVAAFSRLGTGALTNFSTIGVAAIAAIGVSSLKTASDFEQAHNKLTTAAKANAVDFATMGSSVATADNKMVSLGFTTAETESALADLVVPLHSVAKATDVLNVAADLARFKGISLAEATLVLARAEAGRARGLTALGIKGIQSGKDQATIAHNIGLVTDAVQGQSAAFAKNTIAGQLDVIAAQFKQLEVQAGTALLPVLKGAADGFEGTAKGVKDANDATDGWLGRLAKLAATSLPDFLSHGDVRSEIGITFAGPTPTDIATLKDYVAIDKEAVRQTHGTSESKRILAKDEAALAAATGHTTAATHASSAADKDAKKAAENAAKGIYSLAAAYNVLGATVNNNVVGSLKNFNAAAHANLDAQEASKTAGNDLLTTISNLNGAQDESAGSTTTAAQAMFDQIGKVNSLRDAQQGAKDATYDLAIAQRDNAQATQDAKDAFQTYQRVIHGYAEDSLKAGTASENLAKAKLDQRDANLNLTAAERKLAFERKHGSKDEVARAEIALSRARLAAKDASTDLAEAQRILNGTLHGFATNSKEARDAQDRLTGAQDSAHQATVTLREAFDTMHDSLQDVRHAQLDLKGAFDSGTSSGKKLKSTLDEVILKAIEFGDKTGERVARGSGSLVQGFRAEIELLKGLSSAVPGLNHAFDEVIANLERDINAITGAAPRRAVFRASGGPLDAGQLSVVGERGPELFRPRTAGTIIPNHQLNGSDKTVHLHATVVVQETDGGERMIRKLTRALNSGQGKTDLLRALGANV